MLALKLRRIGKKGQAAYRLIVGEKRTKLSGNQLEDLGWYNPHSKEGVFDAERVKYWASKGAQPTDTVKVILAKKGIAL